jgi:Fe-S-cluster containining protein
MASAAEWRIISNHLAELYRDDFLTIRKNVDSGQNCAFRSPYKCLIHDVRPLVCRVAPYFTVESDGIVNFIYPAGTCSERERLTVYVPVDQLDLTKIFFRIRPTEQAKSIHYLNGLRLSNHPSFDIIKRDEVKFVMVWLKEYFTRKN